HAHLLAARAVGGLAALDALHHDLVHDPGGFRRLGHVDVLSVDGDLAVLHADHAAAGVDHLDLAFGHLPPVHEDAAILDAHLAVTHAYHLLLLHPDLVSLVAHFRERLVLDRPRGDCALGARHDHVVVPVHGIGDVDRGLLAVAGHLLAHAALAVAVDRALRLAADDVAVGERLVGLGQHLRA